MNKYNAHKVKTEDGQIFDSKREYDYYLEYLKLEQLGEIFNLRRQVKFNLIPKTAKYREMNYIADFVFDDEQGNQHIIDVKGMILPEFKMKQKIFYWKYGIDIEIVK